MAFQLRPEFQGFGSLYLCGTGKSCSYRLSDTKSLRLKQI